VSDYARNDFTWFEEVWEWPVGWMACEHPERPPDKDMIWHPRCRPCHLKALAELALHPDEPERIMLVYATDPNGNGTWD